MKKATSVESSIGRIAQSEKRGDFNEKGDLCFNNISIGDYAFVHVVKTSMF